MVLCVAATYFVSLQMYACLQHNCELVTAPSCQSKVSRWPELVRCEGIPPKPGLRILGMTLYADSRILAHCMRPHHYSNPVGARYTHSWRGAFKSRMGRALRPQQFCPSLVYCLLALHVLQSPVQCLSCTRCSIAWWSCYMYAPHRALTALTQNVTALGMHNTWQR